MSGSGDGEVGATPNAMAVNHHAHHQIKMRFFYLLRRMSNMVGTRKIEPSCVRILIRTVGT